MNQTGDYRLKNPPHVGSFVKTEIFEPKEISVSNASEALGITRAAMSSFLNKRSSLSLDLALRIEKAFCVGMDTLMRMQNSYDIARSQA